MSEQPAVWVAEVGDALSARTGLDFSGARGRWLRDFLHRAGAPVDQWCSRLLSGDEDAFTHLCEAATVQESYFFREPATLGFLREQVLPDLVERPGPVRVWSAGCAGGEEAYTLAMLLEEAGLADRARVLGTDLAQVAVNHARRGVFGPWSLRGVDDATVTRCFRKSGKGFTVNPRLHAPVEFEQHNLLDGAPPRATQFDLVVCRNVLIYLTPDAIRRVGALLASALRPGGWLITGVSDPSLDAVEGLQPLRTAQGTAYRRCTQRVATATPPPPSATAGRRTPPSPVPGVTARPRTIPAPVAVARAWAEDAERALLLAQPVEAERLAREALAAGRDRRLAHAVLIRALEADNRLGEALEVARTAVDEFPVAADLRGLQAVALLQAARAEEARAAARRALYLDPATPLAHLVLARAAELLGDDDTAQRARRNGQRLLAKGGRP